MYEYKEQDNWYENAPVRGQWAKAVYKKRKEEREELRRKIKDKIIQRMRNIEKARQEEQRQRREEQERRRVLKEKLLNNS